MKLFLHWFRWDLRRFLPMLVFWTLLVLGYASYLGWLHVHILTIKPEAMSWNQPVAVGLWVVQVFLLVYLFSTDPALGTDCFWKTRPPAGFAVAGAKLVIALGFFLALPLLAWLVMNQFCVPPEAVSNGWGERPWTQFLWWSQALLIGTLSLASASVTRTWQIPLRVAFGFGLALTPILSLVLLNSAFSEVSFLVEEITVQVLTNPVFAGISLAAGIMIFLLGRWKRESGKISRIAGMVLPALVLTLVPISPETKRVRSFARESANPTAFAGVRIDNFGRGGALPSYRYKEDWTLHGKDWPRVEDLNNAVYDMYLQISGVTRFGECIPTSAAWQTLRLTAPDGRVLEARQTAMQGRTIERSSSYDRNILLVSSAIFEADKVAGFTGIPCRAEGILRVMLNREDSAQWPLLQNSQLLTPIARYGLPGTPWEFSWLTLGRGAVRESRLVNVATGEEWITSLRHGRSTTGFLMQLDQHLGSLSPYGPNAQSMGWRGYADFKKVWNDGKMENWALKITWESPNGYVDIPVVLEPFILPRLQSDLRTLADLIRAVPWEEGATQEQTKQGLGAVLMLSSDPLKLVEDAAYRRLVLAEKLDLLKPEHLPMLLETARSYLSRREVKYQNFAEVPLKRRIAALLQQSDIEKLQSDKDLFGLLRPELIEAGHVLPELPHPISPKEMSDVELEGWDRVDLTSPLLMLKMIEEALSRGLPWSLAAILEIVRSDSIIATRDADFDFLSEVIDTPYTGLRAKAWLGQNGHKLVWDSSQRKWVHAQK